MDELNKELKPDNIGLTLPNEESTTVDINDVDLSESSGKSSNDAVAENTENATQGKKKGRFKSWLSRIKPSKRKLIQLYAALLFNVNLKGFKNGRIYQGPIKSVCAPGLNCYSCPGASAACPLGSLQTTLTGADKSAFMYVLGILLLYAIIAGRWICGWLCPFGLIQELFYKIKTPKLKKSKFTRILSFFKYVLLVFFVIIVPLLYALRNVQLPATPAFCKYICPAGTFEGALLLLSNKVNESKLAMLGPLFTWKFALMVSFIVGSIFIFRFFCRFFCPLGALYGLFNKISIFGIKLDKPKCIDCGLCISKCKMDIHHVGDHECISCGECIDVCPTKAISFKGSKIFLKDNEISQPVITEAPINTESATISSAKAKKPMTLEKKRKIVKSIVAIALAIIMVGAIVYYNFIDKPPVMPEGYEVGNACPEGAVSIIDANGLTGSTFDPSKNTGKVTVINFWGVWCGPCLAELPEFAQASAEFKDSVTVFAIHTVEDANKAPKYIGEFNAQYKDSNIIFGLDTPSDPSSIISPDAYFQALGGTDTMPMTVILDSNGVITHHFDGKISHETLVNAIEEALKK